MRPLVEPYRNLLVREMHLYQTLCDQANLRREHVLAVRYCLCTALDEAANNTTSGRRGVWAGKSLLVTFHGESEGGIKLFQIIGRLAASFGNMATYWRLSTTCWGWDLKAATACSQTGVSNWTIFVSNC